jgi:sterol desaturase/sphingolipid hydroxylase (fatty acid hydroxylase superfamily)
MVLPVLTDLVYLVDYFVVMESIITYFEHISPLYRSIILFGGITIFWIMEGIIPVRHFRYNKWSHGGINLFFTGTTIVVNFALAFMMNGACQLARDYEFGFWNWIPLPFWLNVMVSLLLLDLVGAYFIHFIEHKTRWMWRFHLIHHTDAFVDTTTANRHHPGESIFRAVFTSIAILICGAPFGVVMLYQSMSALLSQFNHANIRLPLWLDRFISYVLVTPGMHRVHHHYVQPYTDCNYGNLFSVWDRLLGTYRYLPPQDIVFGIDTHPKPEEHSQISNLLQIPFQPYRPATGSKFAEEPSTAQA